MSGCSQIGFRQYFDAPDGISYQYHLNIQYCNGKPVLNIFHQKLDSNFNELSREDFDYNEFELIGTDIQLSIFLYDNKMWFYCNDKFLKTIEIPPDAFLINNRRDLKLWIRDGVDSSVIAEWKSIDIINKYTCDITETLFYDTFSFLDDTKWDINSMWNQSKFNNIKYYSDPVTSNGSIIIEDNQNFSTIDDNNNAYMGLSSQNAPLRGDFEMTATIENFSVGATQSTEGWWSSFYLRLETDIAWDKGKRIHIRLSKGNEHHGDFDGFGLFYYKNGVKQEIGCDYEDGTNCWKQKSQITGDSDKITVKRISDNVSIYIGDTLLHKFDGATTDDLYLTLNTGAFNEKKGSLLSYHVEISEIQANGIICAENFPTRTTLKYDDGTMDRGLVPWSDYVNHIA